VHQFPPGQISEQKRDGRRTETVRQITGDDLDGLHGSGIFSRPQQRTQAHLATGHGIFSGERHTAPFIDVKKIP
jgi:hypothetical protein